MPTRMEAEENLRVIRLLMEKATIYRAISAPGAMLGGVLSLLAAFGGAWFATGSASVDNRRFIIPWLLILTVTAFANGLLLWLDARRRGEAFVSPGMKLVLSAMIPGMVAGGLGLFINPQGGLPIIASFWVLCYGISLLSAAPFAPGSIRSLGRICFATGASLLLCSWLFPGGWQRFNQMVVAHLIMGFTFGIFHIAYAVFTWPRTARSEMNRTQ